MTDIVAAVERRLVIEGQLRPLKNGMQLAELIANECSGMLFDIAKYREKWLQVREIYENAIGDVVSFPVLSRPFLLFIKVLQPSLISRQRHITARRTENHNFFENFLPR
jgi:hypothetical protein